MTTDYVSTNYRGGLGNQLSGIFTTLSYAIDNQKVPTFEYAESSPSITKRSTYWGSIFQELKSFGKPSFDHVLKEKSDLVYDPLPGLSGNVTLDGYFHSHKYYLHNLEEIKRKLKIAEQQEKVKQKFPLSGRTVSVHFRLGDYKHLSYACPPLTPIYYSKCADVLKERYPDYTIIYFCENEDDEYVRTNYLPVFEGFSLLKAPNELSDAEQLLLMSNCNVQVIANSTFSLWAAMLGKRETVLYPNRWFHQETSKDLVLDHWIKVSTT